MIKKFVKDSILTSLEKLGLDEPVSFDLDSPPKPKMGDFATNVAMVLSHEKKQNPRELAEMIVSELNNLDNIEATIAGPGFINIKLDNSLYINELKNILIKKDEYGKQDVGKGKKVNVEFVSANPTGPIHIGNARGGPIGDTIANLYEWLGYKVDREFYINDLGGQIDRLGESIYYWYEKSLGQDPEFPEEGYPGDFIKEVFKKISTDKKSELINIKDKEDIVDFFKHEGVKVVVSRIKSDLKLLGIVFDNWESQSKFEDGGLSQEVIDKLIENKSTTNKEGALWYVDPENPDADDAESVLQKSDGKKTLTYFADDIAYHKNKFDRGYDQLIDVWGSNHHGHLPRIKAALKSIGLESDKLNVVLYQFVRLKNGDQVLKMGKRTGNIINISDLMEAGVTADAFKYFILSQNLNTPIDFDYKLAKDTSEKNPVFYIQYAHARICSILRKNNHRIISQNKHRTPESHPERGDGSRNSSALKSENEIDNSKVEEGIESADLTLLKDDKELALIKELTKFPELLIEINDSLQIQALPHFAFKIATLFHDFYANCQVLSDDEKLAKARLALASSCKFVLKNVLSVCGIGAPKKM